VVSTLHNGIPEGIISGAMLNTGGGGDAISTLVPEKDSAALAEKITLLLHGDALRAKLGEAGRDFVRGKYDMAAIIPRLHALYDGG
jgi:glycosyltransferase involved in cell wall biosynthesis